ncbi:hypothetical protein ACHAWF_015336 [Thalassiosira exigua]
MTTNDNIMNINQKRLRLNEDESLADAPAPAVASPDLEGIFNNEDLVENHFWPLLDPHDLVRLVRVSKAARRAAAPVLNAIEEKSSQTAGHAEMFRSFLRRPRVTRGNHVWKELTGPPAFENAIPGPLRLDVIADRASDIEKRFAVLKYQKSYDEECSLVALFDENGAFIEMYEFASQQFYEDYATKIVMTGEGRSFTTMPSIELRSSSGSCPENAFGTLGRCLGRQLGEDELQWKWRDLVPAQTDYLWQEGWVGNVLLPHINLIDSFAGLLSPTEAMFVLMHALSSDTRGIQVMTLSFFDHLLHDFDNMEDDEDYNFWVDDEPISRRVIEFRQKLLQFSYASTENSRNNSHHLLDE